MASLDVHAVLFREGDWWVGQWLEYDIAAQAKTVKELIYELQRTLIGHIAVSQQEGLPILAHLQRAPEQFWTMYESGVRVEPLTDDFLSPASIPPLKPELHLVG